MIHTAVTHTSMIHTSMIRTNMIRTLCALFCLTTLLFAGPKGTVPRSSASRYSAHAESNGVAVGARLLTSDEARKAFTSDVNRCCVVVEVALYPGKDKPSDVSVNDFDLQVKDSDTAAKPSSPQVVAASLQQKARDQRDVAVSPNVGVVRSSPTYDPAYGPVGGGVATMAGVSVVPGPRGRGPGASDQDRSAMETELSEKGLPEGSTAAPVAGYLYFSLPRSNKAVYSLQYLLNGEKISLTLN
ncbi:MAG TPA: hypothetical protein VF753_21710 [Terriglobales bacterium]